MTDTAIGKTHVRVRYAETDQMGVAYYANYFVWFELGRVEMLRQLGFDYKSMETEDGCMIPVVEANCRYRAPARYDEVLSIETEVAALRGSFLKFRYRIVRAEDNVLLAEGETMHVVTDSEMRKCPLPEKYRDALERVLEKPDRWRS